MKARRVMFPHLPLSAKPTCWSTAKRVANEHSLKRFDLVGLSDLHHLPRYTVEKTLR